MGLIVHRFQDTATRPDDGRCRIQPAKIRDLKIADRKTKVNGAMKPKVLVTREIFDDVLEYLKQYFEVTPNQADTPWMPRRWQKTSPTRPAP